MSDDATRQPSARDRAKRWLANARITASVAANVVNPMAGPVAHQATGDSAKPAVDMSQRVQQDTQRDWARHEQVRRQRQVGEVPPAPPSAQRRLERDR